MAVYRFDGDIGEDHRMEVPADIPTGPVQVVIYQTGLDEGRGEQFRQMVHRVARGPYHTRTRQEIDEEIRRERESWE